MHKTYWGALALSGALLACQQEEPALVAPGALDASSPVLTVDGAIVPATGDAGVGPGVAKPGQLPCAVKTIVDRACGTCHGAPPQFGAPLALTTAAEFQALAPTSKQAAHISAIDRISRTGAGVMPPPPQPPLSAADKTTLLTWLRAGALPGAACAALPAGDAGPAGSSDAGRSDGGVTAPTGDGGGPVAPSDCDVSFELRATDGNGGKFQIPLEDDHYECFYFKSNSDANTLATSLSPLLDDTRVLHHWLLFAAPNENESPSGTHRHCDGIHPGAYLMAAWLPGTPALVLPPDVGMEMPGGQSPQLILENHYSNIPRYQGSDNSGVKVCATKKPKAQHAAIHWLGSERITLQPRSTGAAEATCAPASQQPIHIISVIPHMHKLGRHATMTIMRANGSTEKLHDGVFEFENQTIYNKGVVLNPGDKVTTRCDYMNDTSGVVTLGEKTSNEMCYMFTLAYPVGSMATGGDYLNVLTGQPVVQGPNRCMR
jgi:cytochrome c551/c552